jgi:hypothetical protein
MLFVLNFQPVNLLCLISYVFMRAYAKSRQLKLEIHFLQQNFNGVELSFRLHNQTVKGHLLGNAQDWMFYSCSPAFLKIVSSGKLQKYNLWLNTIPKGISEVYNGIYESALKAGFDITDKEE